MYIALINNVHLATKDLRRIEDNQFIEVAKLYGELLTLKDFQSKYNDDEINFDTSIIRFIETELEVISCK